MKRKRGAFDPEWGNEESVTVARQRRQQIENVRLPLFKASWWAVTSLPSGIAPPNQRLHIRPRSARRKSAVTRGL